jgi:hypothetical protein
MDQLKLLKKNHIFRKDLWFPKFYNFEMPHQIPSHFSSSENFQFFDVVDSKLVEPKLTKFQLFTNLLQI